MSSIHPTAIVSSESIRGDGITIGPYAIIEGGSEIDSGCAIGPHVYIGPNVRLGENVTVGHGASLGGAPQIRPACESPGGVIIGRETTIREYVTVNAASRIDQYTCIGRNALLMAYTHVGHDCDVLLDGHVREQADLTHGHVDLVPDCDILSDAQDGIGESYGLNAVILQEDLLLRVGSHQEQIHSHQKGLNRVE